MARYSRYPYTLSIPPVLRESGRRRENMGTYQLLLLRSLSLSLAGIISELFLSRSPRSHNQILHPTRASAASFHFCVNIFPARRVIKLNLTVLSRFVIQSGANDAARNSETLRSCAEFHQLSFSLSSRGNISATGLVAWMVFEDVGLCMYTMGEGDDGGDGICIFPSWP